MSDQKEKFLIDMTQDENVYLMGFLWADGYISKRYTISLEINSLDFEYIRPILNKYGFTKFTARQRYKQDKKFGNMQTRFCISNKSLNDYMQKFGYRDKSTENPSKILDIIPKDKLYLWWRGFFDGDGCFYCNGAERVFAIWGSINQDWKSIISLLNDIEIQSYRFKQYTRNNGKHCSSCISIGIRDDIKKLGEYIYQNRMDIGFARKYDKYLTCIQTPTPIFKKKRSTKKGIYFSIWTGKWICRKVINKKRVVIGSFDDYQLACDAYDEYKPN